MVDTSTSKKYTIFCASYHHCKTSWRLWSLVWYRPSAAAEPPPHQHLLLQKASTILQDENAAPFTPCRCCPSPWPDLRLWWGSWAWPDRSDSQRLPAFSWLHRPGEVRTLPGKILPCCVLWYYLSWDTGSIGDLIFGGAKYLSFYFSQMSRAINQLPGRREQAGGSEHRKPGVRGDRRGVKEERVQQGNSSSSINSSSSSSSFAFITSLSCVQLGGAWLLLLHHRTQRDNCASKK